MTWCVPQDRKIPWMSIIRSGPVWAIITAQTCSSWATYTILICIPMYMKEVLKFDVKQVPWICLRLSAVRRGVYSRRGRPSRKTATNFLNINPVLNSLTAGNIPICSYMLMHLIRAARCDNATTALMFCCCFFFSSARDLRGISADRRETL